MLKVLCRIALFQIKLLFLIVIYTASGVVLISLISRDLIIVSLVTSTWNLFGGTILTVQVHFNY